MTIPQNVAMALLFFPLALMIVYMDVRYRRIPNKLVLLILLGGIAINTVFSGLNGLLLSLSGFAFAFAMMLFLHVFGTLGAGDVKLFGAIGAISGVYMVLPMLLIVALTGGVLAIGKMIYARRVAATMFGVFQFFYGLLPGQTVPRFVIPADRSYTLPYTVPICFGSLISFFLFHA